MPARFLNVYNKNKLGSNRIIEVLVYLKTINQNWQNIIKWHTFITSVSFKGNFLNFSDCL